MTKSKKIIIRDDLNIHFKYPSCCSGWWVPNQVPIPREILHKNLHLINVIHDKWFWILTCKYLLPSIWFLIKDFKQVVNAIIANSSYNSIWVWQCHSNYAIVHHHLYLHWDQFSCKNKKIKHKKIEKKICVRIYMLFLNLQFHPNWRHS